jgi:flagellar biosynthesis protein FlhB
MFDRLYELLSDSGFLPFAGYVVVAISVVALLFTIFSFITISIRSISNTITKKKDEDDMTFGEQIGEAFERFYMVIGLTLFVSILSVPVFLIIRKVFQLLGQFIDWLLV